MDKHQGMLGKKHSLKTILLMKLHNHHTSSNLGKKFSEEHKKRIGLANMKSKRPDFSLIVSVLNKSKIGKNNPFFGKHHTEETKIKIRESQDKLIALCNICKRPERIVKDHDHKTGKFRGRICQKCNFILGLAGDNTEILSELIKYLNASNDNKIL